MLIITPQGSVIYSLLSIDRWSRAVIPSPFPCPGVGENGKGEHGEGKGHKGNERGGIDGGLEISLVGTISKTNKCNAECAGVDYGTYIK